MGRCKLSKRRSRLSKRRYSRIYIKKNAKRKNITVNLVYQKYTKNRKRRGGNPINIYLIDYEKPL